MRSNKRDLLHMSVTKNFRSRRAAAKPPRKEERKGKLMQSDSPSGLVMQPKAVTSPHKCRVGMLTEEQRRE